jgi:hypothetical protein
MSSNRFYAGGEGVQVQSSQEFPNIAGRVIGLNQLLDVDLPEDHLLPVDGSKRGVAGVSMGIVSVLTI